MQFRTMIFGLALVTQGLASPTLLEHSLVPRDCYGNKWGCSSSLSGLTEGDCDQAADRLIDDYDYRTNGPDGRAGTGNSSDPLGFGGACGVFVSDAKKGTECILKGYLVKRARQQMKDNKCGVCGEVNWNDDCDVKSDYVAPH
ncbi:hypothetical protein NUU61_000471 [Penicillium alfredii]|uniref:Killer toxin Kp4 domain-containing protein n=1 Tax=Penicillium alfredii TaxID=1506179 RepID=A0A9W9GAX2_9EURO|nr:uncharacterized protein NUU61_000471 [Penicillium alfredii]KAJ5114712.1 hypothetical protein NUU61_000471 [Penicillium alfredii]